MTGPKNFSHLLSEEAINRPTLSLAASFKYLADPEFVSLGGGLPETCYFPWDKIEVHSPLPQNIGTPSAPGNEVVTEILRTSTTDIPINKALQYGSVKGQPELVNFLKESTQNFHKVPYGEWDVILNTGNTQGIDACLRTFINKGDSVLIEEYTFGASLNAIRGVGANVVPVVADSEGIIPEKLEILLNQWDPSTNGPKPKFLYTIPTGQNPTGSNLPASRKEKIYKLAQQHDFLIIEDDPYYFLQLSKGDADEEMTNDEFKKSLVKTFLSMDTDGRVIRLESFSKVLAPGSRLGWIVAQNNICEHLLRLHEYTFLNVSGFTQSLVYGLLSRWGHDGYTKWLMGLRREYTKKRNLTTRAISENLNPKLVQYDPPSAGMFFILKLDAAKHPKFHTEFKGDVQKVEDKLFDSLIDNKILMLKSGIFRVAERGPKESDTTFFFRGTYAQADVKSMDIGLKRFAKAVETEFEN